MVGLALMAWLVARQLDGGFYNTPLSAIDLGIHEAGHLLMGFAGEFVMIASGSGFQILAPLVAAALFVRQRDWFAVAFCLFWAGISTGEVGTYAGDAVDQAMPLVSVGGRDVQHDWAALLGRTGLLDSTAAIAGLIHGLGVLFQGVGLAAGSWITWLMWATRGQEPDGG
jgi:hypothetical protein